jgi:hypothetical protein
MFASKVDFKPSLSNLAATNEAAQQLSPAALQRLQQSLTGPVTRQDINDAKAILGAYLDQNYKVFVGGKQAPLPIDTSHLTDAQIKNVEKYAIAVSDVATDLHRRGLELDEPGKIARKVAIVGTAGAVTTVAAAVNPLLGVVTGLVAAYTAVGLQYDAGKLGWRD